MNCSDKTRQFLVCKNGDVFLTVLLVFPLGGKGIVSVAAQKEQF